MKKITIILFSLILCLVLASCGNKTTSNNDKSEPSLIEEIQEEPSNIEAQKEENISEEITEEETLYSTLLTICKKHVSPDTDENKVKNFVEGLSKGNYTYQIVNTETGVSIPFSLYAFGPNGTMYKVNMSLLGDTSNYKVKYYTYDCPYITGQGNKTVGVTNPSNLFWYRSIDIESSKTSEPIYIGHMGFSYWDYTDFENDKDKRDIIIQNDTIFWKKYDYNHEYVTSYEIPIMLENEELALEIGLYYPNDTKDIIEQIRLESIEPVQEFVGVDNFEFDFPIHGNVTWKHWINLKYNKSPKYKITNANFGYGVGEGVGFDIKSEDNEKRLKFSFELMHDAYFKGTMGGAYNLTLKDTYKDWSIYEYKDNNDGRDLFVVYDDTVFKTPTDIGSMDAHPVVHVIPYTQETIDIGTVCEMLEQFTIAMGDEITND